MWADVAVDLSPQRVIKPFVGECERDEIARETLLRGVVVGERIAAGASQTFPGAAESRIGVAASMSAMVEMDRFRIRRQDLISASKSGSVCMTKSRGPARRRPRAVWSSGIICEARAHAPPQIGANASPRPSPSGLLVRWWRKALIDGKLRVVGGHSLVKTDRAGRLDGVGLRQPACRPALGPG